ncbi:MAG: pyridoxamine 5'-phosphate oxidase family protein [Desulfuromonadaceae bacterium]|nr:pyridoxamine 5'-phosphate oxidase family protein [Desulfuromonadaceae bacterium]
MDTAQLQSYFEQSQGTGILSTADADGRVNAALYARPRFFEDGLIGLIMLDRLSHHNLQSNDWAAYLFLEQGEGYRGLRLHLRKVREECNSPLLAELLAQRGKSLSTKEDRFLVLFRVEQVLPLVTAAADSAHA